MKSLFSGFLVALVGLSGALLWSQEDSVWQHQHGPLTLHVATLVSDADGGETLLVVDWVTEGTLDQVILIEERDHGTRETSEVKHIYGGHLILKAPLDQHYLKGSRLYQAP